MQYIFLVFCLILITGCKEKPTNVKKEYYKGGYIEMINFDPQIVDMVLNDPDFLEKSAFTKSKNIPQTNFVDGLYKLRVTWLGDSLKQYKKEVFKSQSAGQWVKVINSGVEDINYLYQDSIPSDKTIARGIAEGLFYTAQK